MTCGQRVRVLKDNGRDYIVGFEGTIRGVSQSGYIVEVDNDPALGRNLYNPGGFARTPKSFQVLRFFLPCDLELVD